MSAIAKILDLETFRSYIQRYLLGMPLPDPLPLGKIIDHVYVVTEPKLNTIVISVLLLGVLIGLSAPPLFRWFRGSLGKEIDDGL